MLLAVGLFNEGVHVPEIGLAVLDVMGNAHQKFRFDSDLATLYLETSLASRRARGHQAGLHQG